MCHEKILFLSESKLRTNMPKILAKINFDLYDISTFVLACDCAIVQSSQKRERVIPRLLILSGFKGRTTAEEKGCGRQRDRQKERLLARRFSTIRIISAGREVRRLLTSCVCACFLILGLLFKIKLNNCFVCSHLQKAPPSIFNTGSIAVLSAYTLLPLTIHRHSSGAALHGCSSCHQNRRRVMPLRLLNFICVYKTVYTVLSLSFSV